MTRLWLDCYWNAIEELLKMLLNVARIGMYWIAIVVPSEYDSNAIGLLLGCY